MACKTPAWNKGGCYPVLRVEDEGNCAGPIGGTKVLASPQFVLDVTNPPDFTWRDEEFTPIQSDDDDTIWFFDNV